MELTKKQLESMLVAERKKSRTKHQQSKFMSSTLNIYNGQKRRAWEERKELLEFTLAEFREFYAAGLEKFCPYSGVKLTVVNATADHDIPVARSGSLRLSNQVVCTKSANFEKGILTGQEFKQIMNFVGDILSPTVFANFKRRLSAGGKALANNYK